jgi:hypothetical protein
MSSEIRVYTEYDGYLTLEILEHFVAECLLRNVSKSTHLKLTKSVDANQGIYSARLYAATDI